MSKLRPTEQPFISILDYTYLGVVIYSSLFDKKTVAADILINSFNRDSLGILVTEDPESINEKILKEYEDKTSIIKRIEFLDYNQAIYKCYDTFKTMIVFDDIDSFRDAIWNFIDPEFETPDEEGNYGITNEVIYKRKLNKFYKEVNDNNNYIIILTNYKTEESTIKNAIGDFENKPLSFGVETGQVIKDKNGSIKLLSPVYEACPVKASKFQDEFIKKILNARETNYLNEIDLKWSQENEDIVDLRKYYNVCYKYDIKNYLDMYRENQNDAMQNLVDIFGLKGVLENAPKIQKLYDNICMNCKKDNNATKRHVIFTAVDSNYGAKLIEAIFNKKFINGEGKEINSIPNLSVYVPKKEDDYGYDSETIQNIITNFNEERTDDGLNYKYNVLIINGYIPFPIRNVDEIHILDTDLNGAYDLVNNIFKIDNYDDRNYQQYKVKLYYTLDFNGKITIDYEVMNIFTIHCQKNLNYLQSLWDSSFKLKLSGGEYVVDGFRK
jgi:hypothetical protein